LRNWAQNEDGTVIADLLVEGPVRIELDTLTVEFIQYGTDGEAAGSEWIALDISGMERGTPMQKLVRVQALTDGLDGLAVDMHRHPAEEVLPRIRELATEP
jgi:hypothetical protein